MTKTTIITRITAAAPGNCAWKPCTQCYNEKRGEGGEKRGEGGGHVRIKRIKLINYTCLLCLEDV